MNRTADLTIKLAQLKQDMESWRQLNTTSGYEDTPITNKDNHFFDIGYKKGMRDYADEFIPQVESIIKEWSLWIGEKQPKRTIDQE